MESSVRVERGESGRRFAVSRDVAASPDSAWELFADTERWPEWGPSVSDVRSPDRRVREGLRGEVQVAGGPWVPFEVTSCEVDESMGVSRWTWSVARVPATGHRVEDRPGGCRLVFEVPLWAGGYVPVCQRALGKLASRLETSA